MASCCYARHLSGMPQVHRTGELCQLMRMANTAYDSATLNLAKSKHIQPSPGGHPG